MTIDLWLAAACALGLLAYLVASGHIDRSFVAAHTASLDAALAAARASAPRSASSTSSGAAACWDRTRCCC